MGGSEKFTLHWGILGILYLESCYETTMVFRPYFGVKTFIRVYFLRFKGSSTISF